MNINVTPDGFVDLGNNNWVSLDRIQQAVLKTQNPGLQVNCPEGEPRKRLGLQTVIINDHRTATAQEHLPLPTMNAAETSCNKQTINSGGEHLPLPPSSHRPTTNQQKPKPTSNSGQEHLPLPSTLRKK